jgi:hypothetical protein
MPDKLVNAAVSKIPKDFTSTSLSVEPKNLSPLDFDIYESTLFSNL